jgi:hypothetical protein
MLIDNSYTILKVQPGKKIKAASREKDHSHDPEKEGKHSAGKGSGRDETKGVKIDKYV